MLFQPGHILGLYCVWLSNAVSLFIHIWGRIYFTFLKNVPKETWRFLNTKFWLQWKVRKSSYQVRRVKLYFDAKHLEKGFDRKGAFLGCPLFTKKCSFFHKKCLSGQYWTLPYISRICLVIVNTLLFSKTLLHNKRLRFLANISSGIMRYQRQCKQPFWKSWKI